MKKALLIILIVLLLALIVGVIVAAVKTNGFKDMEALSPGNSTLTLTINGEELTSSSDIPKRKDLRIYVNIDDFAVTIVPGSSSFDFRHNGALVKFPYVDADFNAAFGVELHDGYFTIDGTMRSISAVLSNVFSGEEITDVSAVDEDAAYFVLRVSAGGQTIEIPITDFYTYLSVELDREEIIF